MIGLTLAVGGATALLALLVIGLRTGSSDSTDTASAMPVTPETRAEQPEGVVARASGPPQAVEGPRRPAPAQGGDRAGSVIDELDLDDSHGLDAHAGARLREPAGEREHYEAFLALAAVEPGALEELAARVLEGADPTNRKVALLRALHDIGSPARARSFALAISSPGPEPDARGISLPAFAIRFLGRHAEGDAGTRGVLRQAVFGPALAPSPSLRRRAAEHLARSASTSELDQLARDLAATEHAGIETREDREHLLRAVARGLAMNNEQRTVALLFAHIPLPDVHALLEGDGAEPTVHEELR